ncbi:MAG: hypothetical protein QOI85_1005, partial [Chloroflexota bacterium]|nr:hypothetical protein [Chloroflexota bacterium]
MTTTDPSTPGPVAPPQDQAGASQRGDVLLELD